MSRFRVYTMNRTNHYGNYGSARMEKTFEEALDDLISDWCKHPGASNDELISAMGCCPK